MARRTTLSTPNGTASFVADIGAADIRDMLRVGRVRFVVEDFLGPLRWQPIEACFDFWKSEVRSHLAEPGADVYLVEWPDEYAYFASTWNDRGPPIVLLRMMH